MILKGNQRAGARELAAHLMNTKDNEHIELHDVRGFMSVDLKGALEEIHAVSRATRCKQYMFSLSLNPPIEENVPIDTFEKSIEKIERSLGLEKQPRVIVFHEKQGRRHAHCVWSRINPETMKAINLPHYKLKLRDISRELYLENGWDLPKGHTQTCQKDPLNFTLGEWQQAMRHDDDPKAKKLLLQKCWRMTDSGKAFSNELERNGYYLARGDRRNIVAVDWRGEIYSLSRWTGASSKELKERMGGMQQSLPPVAEVKERIASRMTEKLTGFVKETEQKKNDISYKLVQERKDMISRHKQERIELTESQEKRQVNEQKERSNRIPKGIAFIWCYITGKYNTLREQNEAETLKSAKRDRVEKQSLVHKQLTQRRTLQKQMKIWLDRHWQQTNLFKRDIASYLSSDIQKEVQIRTAVISHAAPSAPTDPNLSIQDDRVRSRAAVGYRLEANKWQMQIEEISRNPNISADERSKIIAVLRERQEMEANAVSNCIGEEDRQHRKAEQRFQHNRMS